MATRSCTMDVQIHGGSPATTVPIHYNWCSMGRWGRCTRERLDELPADVTICHIGAAEVVHHCPILHVDEIAASLVRIPRATTVAIGVATRVDDLRLDRLAG